MAQEKAPAQPIEAGRPRCAYSTPGPRFRLRLEGHGETSCFGHERVLVALERAQGLAAFKNLPFPLPVGCRRGGCGICRVRVVEGLFRSDAVSRAHVSEQDEAAGLTLSCAIYPLSDLVVRLEPPPFLKLEKLQRAAEKRAATPCALKRQAAREAALAASEPGGFEQNIENGNDWRMM